MADIVSENLFLPINSSPSIWLLGQFLVKNFGGKNLFPFLEYICVPVQKHLTPSSFSLIYHPEGSTESSHVSAKRTFMQDDVEGPRELGSTLNFNLTVIVLFVVILCATAALSWRQLHWTISGRPRNCVISHSRYWKIIAGWLWSRCFHFRIIYKWVSKFWVICFIVFSKQPVLLIKAVFHGLFVITKCFDLLFGSSIAACASYTDFVVTDFKFDWFTRPFKVLTRIVRFLWFGWLWFDWFGICWIPL